MLVEEEKTGIYDVSGITQEQEQRILDFLQGMVYAHCAIAPDELFFFKRLLGGDNRDWGDNPLQVLYDKHFAEVKNPYEAKRFAAMDAGSLLKKVLANEPERCFEISKDSDHNQYKWIRQNL